MKLHKDELIMTVLLVIILFLAAFMRVTKRETGFSVELDSRLRNRPGGL